MIRIDFVISKTVKIVSPNKGFTLMEVLIAVSLSAIIVALVAGAMNVGRSAWEKGSEKIELQQMNRLIETLFRRQLGSICFRQVLDKKNYPFGGSAQNMSFLTTASSDGGDGASLFVVSYKVEQDSDSLLYSIVLEEENFASKVVSIKKAGFDSSLDRVRRKTILRDLDNVVFSYKNVKNGQVSGWYPSWTDPDSFPSAVSIKILKKNSDYLQYVFSVDNINMID